MTKLSSLYIYKNSEARHKSKSIFVQALTTVSRIRWLDVAEIFSCEKHERLTWKRKNILEHQIKFPE
jgi:hypothetical protein